MMVIKYIVKNTSPFYKTSDEGSRDYILIFGDEVQTLDQCENQREKVEVRGRKGWVNEDHLKVAPALEIYYIDVGQGDSTFIVTPGRKKVLIDGGINDRALRFLAWKYRLADVDPQEPLVIDLLVLTHADEDHMNGLIHIVRHDKIRVNEIIHSGIARYKKSVYTNTLGALDAAQESLMTSHDSLGQLTDNELSDGFLTWKTEIVQKGGINYHSVNSSTAPFDLGDQCIQIEVLGPRLVTHQDNDVHPWLDSTSKTVNGNSVILRMTCGDVVLLFTGDLNIAGAKHLMSDQTIADKMDAHVLKAPHHGSHNYYRKWLETVNPQITIISSGDKPDYGHPRAIFLGGVGNASRSQKPLMFSTEIAASFYDIDDDLNDIALSEEEMQALDDDTLKKLRKLFKRRLHGMINVRTNGERIYAARRVDAPWQWESYGNIKPSERSMSV